MVCQRELFSFLVSSNAPQRSSSHTARTGSPMGMFMHSPICNFVGLCACRKSRAWRVHTCGIGCWYVAWIFSIGMSLCLCIFRRQVKEATPAIPIRAVVFTLSWVENTQIRCVLRWSLCPQPAVGLPHRSEPAPSPTSRSHLRVQLHRLAARQLGFGSFLYLLGVNPGEGDRYQMETGRRGRQREFYFTKLQNRRVFPHCGVLRCCTTHCLHGDGSMAALAHCACNTHYLHQCSSAELIIFVIYHNISD